MIISKNRLFSGGTALLISLFAFSCSTTKGVVNAEEESSFRASLPLMHAVESEVAAEITDEILEGQVKNFNILFFTFGEQSSNASYRAIEGKKADGIYVTRQTEDISGFWPIFWSSTTVVKGKAIRYKSIGVKAPNREYAFEQYKYKLKQRDDLLRIRDELVSKRYNVANGSSDRIVRKSRSGSAGPNKASTALGTPSTTVTFFDNRSEGVCNIPFLGGVANAFTFGTVCVFNPYYSKKLTACEVPVLGSYVNILTIGYVCTEDKSLLDWK